MRSIIAILTATALMEPAFAQLRSEAPIPPPGQTAIDPTLVGQDDGLIGALPCSTFSPNIVPPENTPAPFGIPQERWTKELYRNLQGRLATCTAHWDLNNRSFARSVMQNWGENLVLQAANMREQKQAALARKRGLLETLKTIEGLPSGAEQLRKLADFERSAGLNQLPKSDQIEISAVLMRDRAMAEERRQQAIAAEEEKAKARQAALDAEAKQQQEAFQARTAAFSAPVRAFVTRNPGAEKMKEADAGTVVTAVYTMEVSLRLCSKKFGGYDDELKEIIRRRKLFEAFLREVHGWADEKLSTVRVSMGVETGTGRLADMLLADRSSLIQTCDQALAYTSGVLDFGT